MNRVICNTSPIIGLVKINMLHLLWEVFDEVFIPTAVYDELTANAKNHSTQIQMINEAVAAKKIKLISLTNREYVNKIHGKLHTGELEVIFCAVEHGFNTVVIDERLARNMAESMMLNTIGIIGILRLAKNQGTIEAVKIHIDSLIESGYRISEKIYREILTKENEY